MADYTNHKVPDLKKLLQERSLPVSGNKAELISRLQEHDADSKSKPATSAQPAIAPPAEEEIDWDDDDATADAPKPTSDAGAAALAAGGQGQVPNPAAVPNQKVDVDPAATNDLTAVKPAANGATEATAPATSAPKSMDDTSAAAPAAAPSVDFTAGVAATTLDDEIKKRQARAKRFNVVESESDAIKALERAKRFATGTADEQAAGSSAQDASQGGAVKGLDQALPERGPRKRGREGGNDAEGGGKRRDFGGGRGRGRRQGRGGGGEGGGGRRDRETRSGSRPQQGGGGGRVTDDPAEKAKMDARAKKFATAKA